jgi:transcriptional regulator with XRE-family HTH domain
MENTSNTLAERLGKQLKILRKTHYPYDDLEAFALRIGVSKNTYQKIETGKGNPSLNTLIQITNLYDLQDNLLKLFVEPEKENLFESRKSK